MKGFLKTTIFLLEFVVVLLSISAIEGCSRFRSGKDGSREFINVPVSVTLKNAQALNLEEDGLGSLDLLATATSIQIKVTGCASGYSVGTVTPVTISSGTVKLYAGDIGCLVKLESFTLGSATYTPTVASPFSTWLASDHANFQSGADIVSVFVSSQVSNTLLSTDTVAYQFTDVAPATSKSVGQTTVSTGVPLSASGQTAPNFTVVQARYLSTNSDGSANVSFTLQCGNTISGTTLSTYACDAVTLQSQLDYILVTDAYSQGTITVSQANAAFSAGSPTSVGGLIITPGNVDSYNNIVTKGGFYTSDGTPLLTGTSAIYPSNLNNVLMLRRKDVSGNTMSYLYFYVNFTSLTQNVSVSVFGTTYPGGDGTAAHPYLVNTKSGLAGTTSAGSGIYFQQINDIDLGGSATPWTPINLSAQYNGGGFKITGLYQSTGNGGLFSTINGGASVSNLNLANVNITTTGNAGALATTLGGTVSNCLVSGTITSSTFSAIGGIAGDSSGTALITGTGSTLNLVSSSTGTNSGGNFGGFVGSLVSSTLTISNSYLTGTMTFTNANSGNGDNITAGGFLGNTVGGTVQITNSYSTQNITVSSGSVFGFAFIGGMIGNFSATITITGCFIGGSITSTGNAVQLWASGMTGRSQGNTTISNTYTMMSIAGGTNANSRIGGFMSINSGGFSVSNSYVAPSSLTGSGIISGFAISGIGITSTSYLYAHGSVPSQTLTNLVVYTTTTDMQDQTKFDVANGGGFTFGSAANNWKMPSANPLSPGALLSPVQFWQCGSNGIVCP